MIALVYLLCKKISRHHFLSFFGGGRFVPDHILVGRDWSVVPPTHKLALTCLVIHENFVHIGPSVQKVLNIFQNRDTQTNKLIPYDTLFVTLMC